MMTLLHCIKHLPNLRFHHKRIQISTPLIVSHGYSSFLGLNIKQLKPQQFSSSGFPPSLSSELLICVAVMLKCSVRHYERQISCFSCRRPRDERLFDLCPSWWRRRSGAFGTPYSCGVGGCLGGGSGWWIARSGSLYPDAPGGMDAFSCCRCEADVRFLGWPVC